MKLTYVVVDVKTGSEIRVTVESGNVQAHSLLTDVQVQYPSILQYEIEKAIRTALDVPLVQQGTAAWEDHES